MDALQLRGKIRVQAHGRQLVLTKKSGEKLSHVWLKAGLWSLYVPQYPELQVEQSIGHRFKPDVIALAPSTLQVARPDPLFWGECGQITPGKLEKIFHQFPTTHFVVAKWEQCSSWVDLLEELIASQRRKVPGRTIELLCFDDTTPERILDGTIRLEQVLVRRWRS